VRLGWRWKECPSRPKSECGRKADEVRVGFDDGVTINKDPSVAHDPTIQALEPNHQCRIGASAREHSVEQQTALKTIAIKKVH
jgi:hypothetical protein